VRVRQGKGSFELFKAVNNLDCRLEGCDAAYSDRSELTFRRNMLGLSSGQTMDDNRATGFPETSIPFHQNLRINISEYRAVKFFEKRKMNW
jgi:hypothetical protein